MKEKNSDFMQEVTELINGKLNGEKISAKNIADQLGMSPFKFRQKLMNHTNKKPKELLRDLRMQKACRLLSTRSEISIKEVAYLCGYNETSNFSRTFKYAIGKTPTEYREANLSD